MTSAWRRDGPAQPITALPVAADTVAARPVAARPVTARPITARVAGPSLVATGAVIAGVIGVVALPALAAEANPGTSEPSALERARQTDRPLLLHVVPPRDSGRRLGDVVTYRALIAWPDGWEIDRDGIPATGSDNAPIELGGHTVSAAPDQCPNCRWLDLRWQVFKAVRMTEDLLLPAPEIRFRRQAEIATVELAPTVVSVSPLVPWDRRKDWANSMRAGWGPRHLETSSLWWQSGSIAALALLALLGWGWASGRWFVAARRRPFAQAWRSVRRRRPEDLAHADAVDLQHWHRAFDATARQTVVSGRLDAFLAAHPRFAPLADEIREVFEASRRHFFTEADAPAARLPRETLITTLRRLADLEFRPGRQPDTTHRSSASPDRDR